MQIYCLRCSEIKEGTEFVMWEKMRILGKYLLTLLGGVMLGVILLTLAFMVPVNSENMEQSYEIIEKEGWYPVMPIVSRSLDTYFHSYLPGVLDDNTDSLMLISALEATETNPLRAAMDMRGYSYYWHGYVSILRPLLSLFDYGEIRFLNCLGQMLLIFFLMHTLWKKKGWHYALVLFTSYLFLMPMATQMSLQFSWVFYIAYGGMAVLLCRQEWFGKKTRLFLFFMIWGMLTSYFDLLTYPLYTWAIPTIWLLVVDKEDNSLWYYLKKVISTGCCWLIGYAGMWVSKWIIGGLILQRNIFQTAIDEVFLRAGVEEDAAWGLAERLNAMYSNWKHYEYKLYFLILAAWLVWIIYKTIRYGWKRNAKNLAFLLIAFSSVVWYFVLSNHTQGHHFFTYRIWGISITALLVFWIGSLRVDGEKRNLRHLLCPAGFWGVVVIGSVGLAFTAREDVWAMNGVASYRMVELAEEEYMTVAFTPTFPVITSLEVGISTDSIQGEYIVRVYDGEELLYSEDIALEQLGDSTYASVPVEWKLEAGKTYEMQTAVQGVNGSLSILVTENGQMLLNEYGEANIAGILANGQPIAGFVYRHRPLSKATLLFLTISWMGALGAVLLEINQVIMRVFYRKPVKTARN